MQAQNSHEMGAPKKPKSNYGDSNDAKQQRRGERYREEYRANHDGDPSARRGGPHAHGRHQAGASDAPQKAGHSFSPQQNSLNLESEASEERKSKRTVKSLPTGAQLARIVNRLQILKEKPDLPDRMEGTQLLDFPDQTIALLLHLKKFAELLLAWGFNAQAIQICKVISRTVHLLDRGKHL